MNRSAVLVVAGLIGALVVTLIGQALLWNWYVEDSAISFAYARNFAEGWGLVRFPGDERVEGYSNPLWVFLMAGFELVGLDGFQSSKFMSLGLAAVSLGAVWAFFQKSKTPHWGVVAAWVLALDAQFVIWSASGLENGLFCALLALGMWRTVSEEQSGGFPFSAVCFLGLAITRPEGIVYAAFAGFWALVLEVSGPRRWRRIGLWLGVFWIPFAAYHAVRFNYFAFEFPATYYAKLGDSRLQIWNWNTRAWNYLRRYSQELWRFWFLPVFLLGVIGSKRWRIWAVAALSVVAAGLLLYPGVEPFVSLSWWPTRLHTPRRFITVRIAFLLLLLVGVPLLGIMNRGWRGKILAWGLLVCGIGFTLRSTGDWMRGFRWISLFAVPMAVLFAYGCAELVSLAQDVGERLGSRRRGSWVGGVVVALVAVAALIPEVYFQYTYRPETTPNSVHKRVNHYRWAMRKLQIETADIVDHDMGAMLYWGEELGIVRDAKGLIDIPFALHGAERRFVSEYIWDEYPFDLAHAHASTGRAVRRQGSRWLEEYVEIPGYGRTGLHTGNYVRKSLFMRPWDGSTERAATFESGVELLGVEVPSPEVGSNSWLYFEFGLRTPPRKDPIRLMFILRHMETGEIAVYDMPLGFEDWYPVTEWKDGEVFVGRVTVVIDRALPLGKYALGAAVIGEEGVLPALEPAEVPVFVAGEVQWQDRAVEVVRKGVMKREAIADVKRGFQAVAQTRCNSAGDWWWKARAHRASSYAWQELVRPDLAAAIATCYAERSLDMKRSSAVAEMRKARRWDRKAPGVFVAGEVLGDRYFARGVAARADGKEDEAYDWFRDALLVDPGQSWARRYAEQIRAARLEVPVRRGRTPREPEPVEAPTEEGPERENEEP